MTVAKSSEFKDKIKNIGASLVKQVANATNDVAGDAAGSPIPAPGPAALSPTPSPRASPPGPIVPGAVSPTLAPEADANPALPRHPRQGPLELRPQILAASQF
ncbi:hypothetical protein LguiB_000864 [Lonicera macranthoides]